MSVLEGKKPENVLKFFEEIASIPHGSGNVEQISDYLVKFANDIFLALLAKSALL